jgi:hypothetical protein
MAIMLILTLTISAFNPDTNDSDGPNMVAGDYSAVFPLLVVAVFVSLMFSRETVLYKTQRSRGDITAVAEVLCRPGMEGSPLVLDYDHHSDESDANSDADEASDVELAKSTGAFVFNKFYATDIVRTSHREIEEACAEIKSESAQKKNNDAVTSLDRSSSRLDELLGISKVKDTDIVPTKHSHRRTFSDIPLLPTRAARLSDSPSARTRSHSRDRSEAKHSIHHERSDSMNSQQSLLVRVPSFGDIQAHQHQPSLLDQARMRSASTAAESKHRRVPSLPTVPPNGPKSTKSRASSVTPSSVASLTPQRSTPL